MTRAVELAIKKYPRFAERRVGFIDGYDQAKKDTIDRAVKWLCTHHTFDTEEQAQFYAAAFKKAMEKEETE